MGTSILLSIGVVLFVITFIFRPIIKKMAVWNSNQYQLVTSFFDLAPSVIADARLPDQLAYLLHAMAANLNNAKIARHMMGAWLRGRLGNGQRGEIDSLMAEMPADLRERFKTAAACALLSTTYSSLFAGTLLRRFLFASVGMPQHTDEAPAFAAQAIKLPCAA